MWGWGIHILVGLPRGDFLPLYSQFYEVIIFGGTYVINERKMKNESLDIKLRL
jgi:hypothetical protein